MKIKFLTTVPDLTNNLKYDTIRLLKPNDACMFNGNKIKVVKPLKKRNTGGFDFVYRFKNKNYSIFIEKPKYNQLTRKDETIWELNIVGVTSQYVDCPDKIVPIIVRYLHNFKYINRFEPQVIDRLSMLWPNEQYQKAKEIFNNLDKKPKV